MQVFWGLSFIILGNLISSEVKAAEIFGTIIQNDTLLAYFTQVKLTIREEGASPTAVKTLVFESVSSSSVNTEKNVVTLTLNFPPQSKDDLDITKFSMKFDLKSGDYWTTSSYEAEIEGSFGKKALSLKHEFISPIELAAPRGMSFHCGRFGPLYTKRVPGEKPAQDKEKETTTFIPTIEIIEFQIQPYIKVKSAEKELRFGNSYDCVGFFSIGILSGIFINILLVGILTWGLVMIMNVKTMDRFDDPKGKPISIGGTE